MRGTKKKASQVRARVAKAGVRRRGQRKPPPADLREFYGILSEEEARKMIRDIEEAFEHVDAE